MSNLEVLGEFISSLSAFFISNIYPRAVEILKEPFKNEHSIWIVAPLILVLLFIQIYFGKHRDEELGWNTAFGNSISLIFVCANLMKFAYDHYTYAEIVAERAVQYKLILIGVVLVQAFSLLFLDFFHTLPKRIAFFFSSPVFINTTGFIAIVMVYSTIPFDWVTVTAAGFIYVLVIIGAFIITHLVTPSKEAREYLKRLEEKKVEDKRLKKEARRARWQQFKDRVSEKLYKLNLAVRQWWRELFG